MAATPTTHWKATERFQALFPQVVFDADAIYVADPPVHTSAGATAGTDLSLALIETDAGGPVALAGARELVLFQRRPGVQAQFGAMLDVPAAGAAAANIGRLRSRSLRERHGRIRKHATEARSPHRRVALAVFRTFLSELA